MTETQGIGILRGVMNSVLFPYRAFFKYCGFGSYIMSMEEERMLRVARYCVGRVLDVGCGPENKFIRHVYPNGVGIDFFPYEGVETVLDDPTHLPFDDASIDTITLNAVGGHIPRHLRKAEFAEFARILKCGGFLVMTEGEPVTQYLWHKYVDFAFTTFRGRTAIDSVRGMEEDEEYCMPHKEILHHFGESGLAFIKRERFQWGLNNVFVAQKR